MSKIKTIAECKARVNQYDKMLLFSQAYKMEDSFDFERMVERCGRCSKCTYPDAPCRFLQFLHHSLEGYGFIVNELAKEAGIRYNNGSNTVTYFGALLFNKEKN